MKKLEFLQNIEKYTTLDWIEQIWSIDFWIEDFWCNVEINYLNWNSEYYDLNELNREKITKINWMYNF